MLLFLIEKEIKQILRDPIIPRMLIMLPLMTTFVYPWTTNQEIRNVRVNVVDNDHSSLTHKIINEISASDYFNLTGTSSTYPEALEQVESDKTDMILELPTDFEKNLMRGEGSSMMIAANSVNGIKGALGSSYMLTLISESPILKEVAIKGAGMKATSMGFAAELSGSTSASVGTAQSAGGLQRTGRMQASGASGRASSGTSANASSGASSSASSSAFSGTSTSSYSGASGVAGGSISNPVAASFSINPVYKFNPTLNYKVFMIPALIVMVITLICGFLPSLNIVNEKEQGTIEQINVTPVGKIQFILAKMIPLWAIGLIILGFCLFMAKLIYGLTPVGSVWIIFAFAGIYILVVSGLGLLVSNFSSTLQQAMFVMFFFVMILMLMSGLFTPIASMPNWAQYIAKSNPLTYFIQVMRLVYLKGSTFKDLIPQLMVLSGFAIGLSSLAVLSYKKTS